MARIVLENGFISNTLGEIVNILSPLGIEIERWIVEGSPTLDQLLQQETLSESEKLAVLGELDYRFEEQKRKFGYTARDLVVLNSHVPNLDVLLEMFSEVHRHSDDEVRYIVDGSGIFGVVLPDGSQALLRVQAGEYIRVPANTEHWFVLDSKRRVKAVRYFTNKEGWVAKNTGTQRRMTLSQMNHE